MSVDDKPGCRGKKVLIIDPPTGLYIREDRCQAPVNDIGVTIMRPSIESAYIAAVLEKDGAVCMIQDYSTARKTWDDLKCDLVKFLPDVLIVNVTTPSIFKDMHACVLAKGINPRIMTVGKGAHFLEYDKDVLLKFLSLDVVIRQEEEMAALDLVRSVALENIDGITFRRDSGVVRNKDRAFIDDLDGLPFPARHLLDNRLYVRLDTGEMQTTIQTARGCPGACLFCLAPALSGRRLRARSPGNICDEIEACVNTYGIKSFFLRADTFTYDRSWVMRICEEIHKRKLCISWVCNSRADVLDEAMLLAMKTAGCYAITMGIESGSQFILDKIGKGITLDQVRRAVGLCRKTDVFVDGYFMIGFPWDTSETLQETLDFALSLDLDAADFFIAYPFPGTGLFHLMRREGYFDPADFSRSKPYAGAMVRTKALTREELLLWRDKLFRSFYGRHLFLFKSLGRLKSPRMFWRALLMAWAIFCKHALKRHS